MRLALTLAALPLPALAWTFSPDPICTLSWSDDVTDVTVTYDAELPEYTIAVTSHDFTWPDGIFYIRFTGVQPLTISTDRQTVSADGATLTARDRGFGNVLNGLQFSQGAVAGIGGTEAAIKLTGIEPAITAFRACPAETPPTS